MRRIIAHAIRGDAKIAHEAITRDLAEKFDSFPIHERIPPHLTLKRWFELEDKWGYVRYFLDLCVLILFTFRPTNPNSRTIHPKHDSDLLHHRF